MLLFSSKDCNGFLFPKVNSDLCDLAPASLSSLILFPVQNAPDTLAFFLFLNTLNLSSAQDTWICWSSQKYSSNSFYCRRTSFGLRSSVIQRGGHLSLTALIMKCLYLSTPAALPSSYSSMYRDYISLFQSPLPLI